MTQSSTFILKVFLIFLSLHFSLAWGMEQGDNDCNHISHGISYHLPSQGQALSEEDLKAYTHSHSNCLTSHMKALYIGTETKLVLEDQEQGRAWERPVLSTDDDTCMRLVKEAFVKYPGNNSPNHLIVKIETAYFNPKQQTNSWRSFFLGSDGAIRDFCSAPPPLSHPLNLNIDQEKSERVVVTPGTQLKREGEKLKPAFVTYQFPLLAHMDHRFIPLTENEYPHSEMEALNALLAKQIMDQMITSSEKGEFLSGIIIKFYSYNDICPECQLAINNFMPRFQALINEKCEGRNIPTIPVGIVNHCYGWNSYYHKEENCKKELLYNNSKSTMGGIQYYLNEGVTWETLRQSRYNPRIFPFHYFGGYRPFCGTIRIPSSQNEPQPLYIYVRQPDLSDIREFIKPDFIALFTGDIGQ